LLKFFAEGTVIHGGNLNKCKLHLFIW